MHADKTLLEVYPFWITQPGYTGHFQPQLCYNEQRSSSSSLCVCVRVCKHTLWPYWSAEYSGAKRELYLIVEKARVFSNWQRWSSPYRPAPEYETVDQSLARTKEYIPCKKQSQAAYEMATFHAGVRYAVMTKFVSWWVLLTMFLWQEINIRN